MKSIHFGVWPILLVLALCLTTCPQAGHATELAGVMPQQTVLYLEWSGADAVKQAYAATAMGKLAAEPEARRFGAELLKSVDRLLVAPEAGPELKQAAMVLQLTKPLLKHLWHQRVALSLIGAETTEQGLNVAAVLAIALGEDKQNAAAALQGLLNMATMEVSKKTETIGNYTFQRVDLPGAPPIHFGVVDDLFLVTVGVGVLNDVLAVKSAAAPALSANERFAAARRKLGLAPGNTVLTVHLDLPRLREQVKPFLAGFSGDEEFPSHVETLLEELGLNNIKSLTYSGQLADGGFRNSVFIAAPGPSKGVLKLFDAAPLADEDFHSIPADASLAAVKNFDLATAFDEALRIATLLAPEEVAGITQKFEQYTGLKLREDVIGQFDDGWAFFNAPSQGGLWLGGMNVVIEAKEPQAFLGMLDNFVALVRKAADEDGLTLKTYDHRGHTIHYVTITAFPSPVAPAWASHGKRVVIALFPQMVAQTLDLLAAPDVKDRCILANADFARGRKLLPPSATSVTYIDTKQGVAGAYKLALPALTLGCSVAAANGIPIDMTTIPTERVVTRHLFGDIRSVSHDAEGVMLIAHGPLPFPVPSVGAGVTTAQMGVLASILLPSISRARELSKRLVSAENLSGIGQACHLYAFDHQEQFPPNLETLAANGLIKRSMLISHRDPSPGSCSYVYIAGQSFKSDTRNVLVYEPNYDGEGGNILFVDGHAEFVRPPEYQRVIDETYKRLGKEPPPR
ncbi:MAG: hypothetical protein KAV82_10965 [Phycisphaerae bacterium]|nr:hypothetical protein [Phycisphaerae bacterium]